MYPPNGKTTKWQQMVPYRNKYAIRQFCEIDDLMGAPSVLSIRMDNATPAPIKFISSGEPKHDASATAKHRHISRTSTYVGSVDKADAGGALTLSRGALCRGNVRDEVARRVSDSYDCETKDRGRYP